MRIPIVNEQDEIIGDKDRTDRNDKDIIRVSALAVRDKAGNILLTQRAFSKRHDPGLWGISVAGTVEEGETYEFNIIKEAEEEINLKGIKPELKKKVFVKDSHCFFCQIFNVVVDREYEFVKKDSEVENIKWFSVKELEEELNKNPAIFSESFKKYINYILN